jgi:hypothetical protein
MKAAGVRSRIQLYIMTPIGLMLVSTILAMIFSISTLNFCYNHTNALREKLNADVRKIKLEYDKKEKERQDQLERLRREIMALESRASQKVLGQDSTEIHHPTGTGQSRSVRKGGESVALVSEPRPPSGHPS